jgi:hypothetical protein
MEISKDDLVALWVFWLAMLLIVGGVYYYFGYKDGKK